MANSYTIPTEKILDRLRFENPWWETSALREEMKSLPKRLYFKRFFKLLNNTSVKRAIIVVGPRRVGKTVMMHQAIELLIAEKKTPRKIFYIGIDNPVYITLSLEDLLNHCIQASGIENADDCFIFFDEIQYLRDWERHLKIIADSYPKTKFIVSGSAAAALQAKSAESGAGRFTEFVLPPLTFQEFLHLQNLTHLLKPSEVIYANQRLPFFSSIDIKQLNRLFFEYINYGGYPEVIFAEAIRGNMSKFIRNDIIDKVLLRDLPALYGIKDVQELYRFFAHLAYHSGKEFSPEKLSRDSGLDKTMLKRYLEYLESAFLIKVLHKVDVKAGSFKRITAYKIYLTNPSLRTALFSPVSLADDESGNMVETAIIAQWMHRDNLNLRYARWKQGRSEGEVDLINLDSLQQKPIWAVEIKWSNRYVERPWELKSVLEFCKQNTLTSAVVTTIDKENHKMEKDIHLSFIPASVYSYVVGSHTLKEKEE